MRAAIAAGPQDVQTVLVISHADIPMAFNDAMWAKYQIGRSNKVKDDSTKRGAIRNPFLDPPSSTPAAPPNNSANRPRGTLTWLATHGHILLGCDHATRGFAETVAEKTKRDMQLVYAELNANLIPGVILHPSGVYAAHRAQEAGYTYVRST